MRFTSFQGKLLLFMHMLQIMNERNVYEKLREGITPTILKYRYFKAVQQRTRKETLSVLTSISFSKSLPSISSCCLLTKKYRSHLKAVSKQSDEFVL